MRPPRIEPSDPPSAPSSWPADRILLLRRFLGWTQEQLGNELEVNRQTVSEWERGTQSPRPIYERSLDALKERSAWES